MHRVDLDRRLVLRGGLAAGSLFLPAPYAWVWAQSEGTMKLLKAPKVALVLGNSKYKEAPLKNAANDAKAMADALKACGFDVTLKVDGGKADMAAAVQAYVQTLTAKKCIGLFYYAGHGIQLAWRNYMLPVDADLDTIADIQKQGVEVNALMEGLTKAANPMNIVILDACRDNPFGKLKGVDQKGLSQMDAPNNTIISYATAPGNVASDGDGANGLYTENLLREVKVKEAKVEDVFKRVRLNVRKRSNGAQVPWDSSSLEDDFYFLPPDKLKKLSETESEAEFKVQLAIWERIKDSRNADDFFSFLEKYPSGPISEQAQFRLDQLQKPKVEVAPAANGIKVLPSGTNRYATGDVLTYEVLNRTTGSKTRSVWRVTQADNDKVVINEGELIFDQMGATLKNEFGTKAPGILWIPVDLSLGMRWRSEFINTNPRGIVQYNWWESHVVALEEARVPAGKFMAFKVVRKGEARFPGGTLRMSGLDWIDPATMLSLRSELVFQDSRSRAGGASNDTVNELADYKRVPR
jgi:hypothetical protein